MRVFTSSNDVVSYEPVGPEDEQEARQQTQIANHYLTRENNSFLAMYNWFKDTLMYPNGYIKLFMDERITTSVEEFEGLDALQLQAAMTGLMMQGEVQVVEQESTYEELTDMLGNVVGQKERFAIKVRITKKVMEPKLVNIPPDELLVAENTFSIDLDEADFICHRVNKTYSELVEMGYDRELLDEAGVTNSRFDEEDENKTYSEDEDDGTETDPSMRMYTVNECYLKIDEDGDGIAEHRKICLIGSTIFADEEINYQPFVALTTIPLPHQHPGLSMIDAVKDIQKIKSTLMRNMLDNIYKANVRRKYVGDAFISDEAGTLDVLLDTASEFIPARDPGALREEQVQPIVSEILPVIKTMDEMQGIRTGVTPQLSLDPNILRETTMGAYQSAISQASQRVEMIVRIFGETGVRQLFIKMHQLLRTSIDQDRAIRIRGEWIPFNPSTWRERNNVSVAVGLGHNSKSEELKMLTALLEIQKEAVPFGLASGANVYNTLDRMVELGGIGETQTFFTDPATIPPKQPEGPSMAEQLAMIDLQNRKEESIANLQMKSNEMQMKAQQSATEAQAQMSSDMQKMQMEMAELQAKLAEMDANKKLKEAQTYKTLEEARGLDIENDGTETGVVDLLTEQLRG
tara:strand:- start:290 stop:2185 length:1896 start_codon:yes stop_codon:yes gene_type:complete